MHIVKWLGQRMGMGNGNGNRPSPRRWQYNLKLTTPLLSNHFLKKRIPTQSSLQSFCPFFWYLTPLLLSIHFLKKRIPAKSLLQSLSVLIPSSIINPFPQEESQSFLKRTTLIANSNIYIYILELVIRAVLLSFSKRTAKRTGWDSLLEEMDW